MVQTSAKLNFIFHSPYRFVTDHSLCLVTTAVAEFTCRCLIKVINIVKSTISDTDFREPFAAVVAPVKTHLSINLCTRNVWMAPSQPAGCMSATSVCGWTNGRHSCSCCAFKSEPARMEPIVTLDSSTVGHLSVRSIQTCIVLTFCGRVNRLFPVSQYIKKRELFRDSTGETC